MPETPDHYWVTYGRKFNLGNYRSETIEIIDHFDDDVPKKVAIKRLRKLVFEERTKKEDDS